MTIWCLGENQKRQTGVSRRAATVSFPLAILASAIHRITPQARTSKQSSQRQKQSFPAPRVGIRVALKAQVCKNVLETKQHRDNVANDVDNGLPCPVRVVSNGWVGNNETEEDGKVDNGEEEDAEAEGENDFVGCPDVA